MEVGLKLHHRASDVGCARDPGMANKENELKCSDVWGNHYKDCGLPVNSAEASKMAGASSKYSEFAEVSDGAAVYMCRNVTGQPLTDTLSLVLVSCCSSQRTTKL